MMYRFKYKNGVVQLKKCISHEDWQAWRLMPEDTEEQDEEKKAFWKTVTGGEEWFTDQSPYYMAIETGIINCNGNHPCEISKIEINEKQTNPL